MKELLLCALLTIPLISMGRADVARVAELKNEESIEVVKVFRGNVGQETKFTFSADKVVIAEEGKIVGELKLTANERALVDKHLNWMRQNLRKEGRRIEEGTTFYSIRFYRRNSEKKGDREEGIIASPAAGEAKALTLEELRRRAGK